MKNFKLGINAGVGYPITEKESFRMIAEAGFDACFTGWKEGSPVEEWAEEIAKNGLIYQSIHSPFGKVYTLWEEGEEGEAFTDELIRCVEDCSRANVGIMVVHPIIGMERHTPTEIGLLRFARLVEKAEKSNVRLAFENVEGIEYLHAVIQRFGQSDSVGFCWDTGHEMCYNFSEDVMARYGDRLIATHFNDNLGMTDPKNITWHDDLHLLPMDGIADWQGIMNRIQRHGYEGILTFELTIQNKPNKNTHDEYARMNPEAFYAEAYKRATAVASFAKKK